MRILQIHNKYLEQGGEDTVVANERALLKQYGHEVEICAFDNKDLDETSKLSAAFKTLFNVNSYKKVVGYIHTFKPDVIHLHNIYYTASPSVWWALKRKKIPAVMTIHNYRLGCIQSLLFREGHICRLCVDNKSSWSGIKHKCFKSSYLASGQLTFVNFLNKWFIRHFKPVRKFIFLSAFTQNILSPLLKIGADEAFIKPNFVEDFGFSPFQEREDYYLFVGRLSEQKGVKILVNTFIKNQKRLDIIGTGQLEEYVKIIAAAHPNIRYHGYAERDFIISKLKKSRAVVVPSITYEGQPMTILEAYSTGTPVLASNIKNLDSIVKNGQTGYLFDPLTEGGIQHAISIFENEATTDLYNSTRRTYEQTYSPASNYRQLMAIYQGAIVRY